MTEPKSETRPKYISPTEAGKALSVHARTAVRWAEEGALKYFRTPSGHYKILAESVASLYFQQTGEELWPDSKTRPETSTEG